MTLIVSQIQVDVENDLKMGKNLLVENPEFECARITGMGVSMYWNSQTYWYH